jgi:predicted RNA-binding Zn ribbon-like protein
MAQAKTMETHELLGEPLCLEFTNTASTHLPVTNDHLRAYGDLLVWARRLELIDAAREKALARAAERRPDAAAAVTTRALVLREAVFRLVVAAAAGDAPGADDLDHLNGRLAAALPHRRLRAADGRLEWAWEEGGEELEAPLWPVVASAASLLTSEEVRRVKTCGGEGCDWLFVDASRNRSRRWCDMRDCGNRAKARRHYHRQKSQAG